VVRVIYSGSVTPERLPFTFLEAMARTRGRIRLRVVGYATIGYPRYIDELRLVAQQLGIDHDVDFVGVLPRHRLQEIWEAADVGLALNPMEYSNNNSRWMVGAANKPFDYMANGLALLVSDLPEWRDAFVLPGYAVACDPRDPISLTNTLHWLADHPCEAREMGERGRQQIVRAWNYEAEFEPVVAHISGLRGDRC
jgi:glycosyltransferase involved in cell wall biosynthesis